MNKTILQDNETQSIELEQAIIPTAIDWSEPILFEEIAPPSIPTNLLPDWLGNFAEAVSKSSQTPPEMSIMFALSVLSTCLQGKVEVSPTGGDYFEPVNIWTLTALPPSSRKSAVVKMMIEPLMQWEKEQAAKLQPLIDEQETTKVINQKRANELQVQAAKEADVDARKIITKEIATLKAASSDDVIIPQLFTGDITAEELQNLLVRQNEKMSVLADEGGIFEVMTGLYNDGKVNIDVFLQAYSGSAVRVNRGQRTVSLDRKSVV